MFTWILISAFMVIIQKCICYLVVVTQHVMDNQDVKKKYLK